MLIFRARCGTLGKAELLCYQSANDAQKSRRSLGSDLFMVELEDKFGNKQATGVIEEEGDGKYSVTYAVPEDAETGS